MSSMSRENDNSYPKFGPLLQILLLKMDRTVYIDPSRYAQRRIYDASVVNNWI